MGKLAEFMKKLGMQRTPPAPALSPRRGSDASISNASSNTFVVVSGVYVSSITRNLLDSLNALIEKNKTYWSKISNSNIALTPEHIALRKYIFRQLNENALGIDEKIRQKPVEDILVYFRNAWIAMHPAPPTAPPTPQAQNKSLVKSVSGTLYNYSIGLVWKSTPAQTMQTTKIEVMTDEQVMEDITGLFTPVIHSIKHDYTDDIEGMIRHWETRSTQSPPSLPFRYGNNQRADEIIKIVESAYQVKTHYIQVAEAYNKETFKKEIESFVKKTCELLQNYYVELLKLNLDLKPTHMLHWKQESAQKALDFYFDQREYLYKILSLINAEPEINRKQKITLMRDYKKFIKEKYEREAIYKTTLGPFAFGLDKWTKIDAAMEQYRVFCDFPGEEILLPASDKYDNVRCAGEDGELKELKGRGLYFRYRREVPQTDPFIPLNIYGAVKPIPPH